MDLSTQQHSQLRQASPAAQPTPAAGNYPAHSANKGADKQRINDSIRRQVGHVIDCLVCPATLARLGCTVDQLWDWHHSWGKARFQHYHGKFQADSCTDTFLNAVRQWAAFCEATYPDCADKYHVTPGKVVPFIDWWTSKPRELYSPHSTLESYIGTHFTKLRFLQEAARMELPQLEEAVLQPLLSNNRVMVKMYDVRDVAAELKKG
jgi:hypothetical protein